MRRQELVGFVEKNLIKHEIISFAIAKLEKKLNELEEVFCRI
jgi:hypothetical protein